MKLPKRCNPLGLKLSNHIFDIITRIRKFAIVYADDITKMYRQIFLRPEDQIRFRILWRAKLEEPLKEYFSKTVNFGSDCVLWQAIRRLYQVVEDSTPDEKIRWIIKNASSVNEAQKTIERTVQKGKLPVDGLRIVKRSNNIHIMTEVLAGMQRFPKKGSNS